MWMRAYFGNSPFTRATYCFRIVRACIWFMKASAPSLVFAMNMSPLVNLSSLLHAAYLRISRRPHPAPTTPPGTHSTYAVD